MNNNFKLLEIDSIEEIEEVEMIDLSVQKDESFTLSNGLISHNSAAGAFRNVRNSKIHSILPLKGKVPNVKKLTLKEVLKNPSYQNIIGSLRLTGDNSDLRHGKVYIATDTDPDGKHIRILLIQFFAKFFPEFIDEGRLFILNSPLYEYKLNKTLKYSYGEKPPPEATDISYFKGLGSNTKTANKEIMENPKLLLIKDSKELKKIYRELYDY